jgi:pimeloyl-ACP methyl ester carboxylesterase
VLGCTYAFNMATRREQLEGHVAPALVGVLGPKLFAKLGVSLGAKELAKERAEWLIGLMGDQDRRLMVSAWQQTMAFDSRKRLADIGCPTLIIAGSQDRAVPMHHATMLHEGIPGSRLVVVNGAAHTLIWTHTDEFVRLVAEFLEPSSPLMAFATRS